MVVQDGVNKLGGVPRFVRAVGVQREENVAGGMSKAGPCRAEIALPMPVRDHGCAARFRDRPGLARAAVVDHPDGVDVGPRFAKDVANARRCGVGADNGGDR